MNGKIKYSFSARMWRHSSSGGWYFVTIPKDLSEEIRKHLQWQEEGWGRMKATVMIKEKQWNTSIWFDTGLNRYILPVKAEIRKRLSLYEGDIIAVSILI